MARCPRLPRAGRQRAPGGRGQPALAPEGQALFPQHCLLCSPSGSLFCWVPLSGMICVRSSFIPTPAPISAGNSFLQAETCLCVFLSQKRGHELPHVVVTRAHSPDPIPGGEAPWEAGRAPVSIAATSPEGQRPALSQSLESAEVRVRIWNWLEAGNYWSPGPLDFGISSLSPSCIFLRGKQGK